MSSNLGKYSEILCIRLDDLEFANFHKSCANLKKSRKTTLIYNPHGY